jgi:hypothetical protein
LGDFGLFSYSRSPAQRSHGRAVHAQQPAMLVTRGSSDFQEWRKLVGASPPRHRSGTSSGFCADSQEIMRTSAAAG